MAFFDCHRKKVSREAESNLWSHVGDQNQSMEDSWTPELTAYAVSMASPDEILIVKTPHIMYRDDKRLKFRAELMKKPMKDVKILVMLCDTIKRFISLEKHPSSATLSPSVRDELTGIELTISNSKLTLPSLRVV